MFLQIYVGGLNERNDETCILLQSRLVKGFINQESRSNQFLLAKDYFINNRREKILQ